MQATTGVTVLPRRSVAITLLRVTFSAFRLGFFDQFAVSEPLQDPCPSPTGVPLPGPHRTRAGRGFHRSPINRPADRYGVVGSEAVAMLSLEGTLYFTSISISG